MEMQNTSKKPIIIAVIAAVLAVCLIVFGVKFFVFDAPGRAAAKATKLSFMVEKDPSEKNIKKALETMSQLDVEEMMPYYFSDGDKKADYDVNDKDDVEEMAEKLAEKFEDDDSENSMEDAKFKKSKTVYTRKFTKDQLDDLKDYVDDKEYEHIEGDDIKSAYTAVVYCEYKNEDDELVNYASTCTVLKERGKWRVSTINWLDRIAEDDDDED